MRTACCMHAPPDKAELSSVPSLANGGGLCLHDSFCVRVDGVRQAALVTAIRDPRASSSAVPPSCQRRVAAHAAP
jgi:hypothetical protein